MRINTILTTFILVALLMSLSMAQYSARESFNYPLGVTLDTLMGGAKDGWAGSWYKITTSQANAAVVSDTAMLYDALPYAVPHVGNCLTSVPDPTGTELRWCRDLDKVWPNEAGKEYWISILMDVKNATDNSTWIGVKFYNGPNGESGMLGKGHGLDKYTCGSGWHGGPGNEVSNTPWTVGPVWLVGKVVMKGAAETTQDTVYMWINPDPEAGEPNPATAAAYTSLKYNPGFDRMRIEFGGTVGTGLSVAFDELRMGTSWSEVSENYGLVPVGVLEQSNNLPNQFDVYQNYPNPFNPTTTISYTLKSSGHVRLLVYDVLGRHVATLIDGVQSAGLHRVSFSGERLTSGVYFYRVENAGTSITKKMVLVK